MTKKGNNKKGWHGESVRHSKAAKGIKTGTKNKKTPDYAEMAHREAFEESFEPTPDIIAEENRRDEYIDKLTQYGFSKSEAEEILDDMEENEVEPYMLDENNQIKDEYAYEGAKYVGGHPNPNYKTKSRYILVSTAPGAPKINKTFSSEEEADEYLGYLADEWESAGTIQDPYSFYAVEKI